MTSDDADDAGAAGLDALARLAPDPDRAERVRARCRARLGRGRRRSARMAVMTGRGRRLFAPVVIGGFCVLYVVALVTMALRLEGVLP